MSQCSRGAVRNIPRNVSHHSFRISIHPPRSSMSRLCSANTLSISWPKFARKSEGKTLSNPRNTFCEGDRFVGDVIGAIRFPFLARRTTPFSACETVSSRAPAIGPHPFVPLLRWPLPCQSPSAGSNAAARHPGQLPAARPIPRLSRRSPGAPSCRTRSRHSNALGLPCAAPLPSELRSHASRRPPERSARETSLVSSAKTIRHLCSELSKSRLRVDRSVPLHTVLYRAKDDYTVTRYSAWHVRGHPAVCISAGKSGALRRRAYLERASAVRSWDEGIP